MATSSELAVGNEEPKAPAKHDHLDIGHQRQPLANIDGFSARYV